MVDSDEDYDDDLPQAQIKGQVTPWPLKDELANLLQRCGLPVYVGRYSIRFNDIAFARYGKEAVEPVLEGSSFSLEAMLKDARRLSAVLAKANLTHKLEIFDQGHKLVESLP